MEKEIHTLSSQLAEILIATSTTIATAESCTGGLLSHVLTGVSGSSQYFIGGVVAYSNPIKEAILGVSASTLKKYGAVSQQTAIQMAAGIRQRFNADIGLSTTGIAGPTGGTPTKPVGLVWIGISSADRSDAFECHFIGGRNEVKLSTVRQVLIFLHDRLKANQ